MAGRGYVGPPPRARRRGRLPQQKHAESPYSCSFSSRFSLKAGGESCSQWARPQRPCGQRPLSCCVGHTESGASVSGRLLWRSCCSCRCICAASPQWQSRRGLLALHACRGPAEGWQPHCSLYDGCCTKDSCCCTKDERDAAERGCDERGGRNQEQQQQVHISCSCQHHGALSCCICCICVRIDRKRAG